MKNYSKLLIVAFLPNLSPSAFALTIAQTTILPLQVPALKDGDVIDCGSTTMCLELRDPS